MQHYRDKPDTILTNSESFKSNVKITGSTPNDENTTDDKITVPLKYLSYFWRTLELHLINCENNLILTWSADYIISSATEATKIAITDAKIYVPVNVKLFQQLKTGFKRSIN